MKRLHGSLLAIILIISSCNQSSREGFAPMDIAAADQKSAEYETTAQTGGGEQINLSADARKLIKTGSVSFETNILAETKRKIADAVSQHKAYIAKENESRYEGQMEHSLEIRVPSENFDKLLEAISQGVDKFDSKNIEVTDVTEEYVDIEARIKTKKELENRYREMLAKADAVDEMLAIENQIGQLHEDRESIEGRLKYLQSQVAYSTLSVRYYETLSVSHQYGEKFKEGFSNGWNNLVMFLVGLINVWPFVIILLMVLWIVLRFAGRRKHS